MSLSLPVILCTFLGGLAFESALRGTARSASQIAHAEDYKNVSAKLILACNLAILADVLTYQVSNLSQESNCYSSSFAGEALYHVFMVLFDIFLLFKTWMIVEQKTWFMYLSVFLVMNRLAWGAAESYLSYGSWDSIAQSCNWNSDGAVMTGVYVSDMAIDLVSTIAILAGSQKHKSTDFKQLFQVMIKENLIRSTLSLAITCFGLYATWSRQASTVQFIFYSVQTYIVCHLLNSEYYWLKRRNEAIPDDLKVWLANMRETERERASGLTVRDDRMGLDGLMDVHGSIR
ncbi:hypothetical protein HDU98_001557 [Podochytrium sp. JEL0797]|nr:hypothetical protein HDU98_001557 [Podochytrium sp. JEL0797]